ncbi:MULTISPECIES: hypothetical protein [unclassified Microcoleus]|uniref:hypothetical protein n=1 Tax=unclassified Microcoleus TaxID=2642155 RepID=UPI0025D23870|nr:MULTISPECIES: hypothetical protein [unclassified Microcoleus]
MIHHISVSAQNPQHVAQVLAEVLKGQAVPFQVHPNSYMVIAMDEHGTAIEVLPSGVEISPGSGPDGCSFMHNPQASQLTATHAAVSVPSSQTEIEQIGKREGWRVVRCDRESFFDVIEFWVENHLMLEFLTPEMTAKYLAFTQQPDVLKNFVAAPTEAIA